MRVLSILFFLIFSFNLYAGGSHCVLKEGIEANNYSAFSEYFVEGKPYIVHAVKNDGQIISLNCDRDANGLGSVTNCGSNRINFPLDNKVPNDNSIYDCKSLFGFQNASEVLNQE